MANKWYHRHGSSITEYLTYSTAVTAINAPNDNTVGNVYYLDPNHPNASDVAANRGCANVPYKTLATLDAEVAVWSVVICAPGSYSSTGSSLNFISDTIFGAIFSGTGYANCFNRAVLRLTGAGGGSTSRSRFCIWDSTTSTQWSDYGIFLKEKYPTFVGADTHNICIDFTNIPTGSAFIRSLFYNCVKTETTTAANLYNRVFWNGTINYNATISNLTTICAQITAGTLTENQAIAQVETDLGLAADTLKNNGFRLLNPHFINPAKGNYNIDFLNYDCSAILAVRDAYNWIINRGVRCEYPADFVGTSGFGETADPLDGFGGELYSRNINNVGAITNVAYDTVIVSKKYKLPANYVIDRINYFGKLISSALELNATENDGTDVPNLFTFYLLGVSSGVLEDEFNSANYSFDYTAGVLTTDLPIFIFNQEAKQNKIGDVSIGACELGSYNLNYARDIFATGVVEFRIIAVKKGV